jgi:TolB protein
MKKILIKSMVLAVAIFLSVLFVLPSTAYADSSMIAFSSDRDENPGIYTMNIDGSDPKMLIDTPVDSVDSQGLHLSPDGSKIAYVSSIDFPGPGGNYEIYIMNVDGSDLTNLTNSPGDDGNSSFSPDGSKIVFMSERDGNYEIYIMNIDGSGQVRLTNNPAFDEHPCFSPDGSKISFTSDRNGNWEIYIMNIDGSGQVRLTNIPAPAANWWPCFSPDGSKIAFASTRDGNEEIYIMNVDGSGQTRLTNNPTNDAYPSFSPDGSKIAFTFDRFGNSEIYIMNIDGSGQTNLTNNPAQDYYPTFLPRIIEDTDTNSKSKILDFVTRFYQLCLSRDPDSAGLNGWVNWLVTGAKTGADVAYGFVFSDEFIARNVSNEQYVTILYRAFFNREPDSGGYSGWLGYLNTGASRQWVLAGFINSQEFKNLCAAYGINPGSLDVSSDNSQVAAFVTRFYQLCLSRDPDSAGLNTWVNWLVTGAKTGADVAYGFVFSDEFIARNVSNEQYLTILYRAFFNREPDSGGYSGWLGYLNTGASRQWVLAGFINSQEFKNLCAAYGINPGSINI